MGSVRSEILNPPPHPSFPGTIPGNPLPWRAGRATGPRAWRRACGRGRAGTAGPARRRASRRPAISRRFRTSAPRGFRSIRRARRRSRGRRRGPPFHGGQLANRRAGSSGRRGSR